MKATKDEINSVLNYDFLYQKYVIEELSTYEICNLVNNIVKREKMRLRLIELGIPVRSRKECKNTETSRAKMKACLGSEKTKQKRLETNLSRYGVENPSQYQVFKDKKVQTSQLHYGTDYPLQDKNVKDKIQKIWIDKYGVDNPNKSKIIRDKTKHTCIEKYGYVASFMHPDIRKKCIESLNQHRGGSSKISIKLFDNLCNFFSELSDNFKYSGHGDETTIKNTDGSCYYLDFSYDKDGVKFDIEFNGDYYHMNPKFHNSEEKVPFPNDLIQKASDLWIHDDIRKKTIESNGYKVLTVWEYDYVHEPDKVLKECYNFINNCLGNK